MMIKIDRFQIYDDLTASRIEDLLRKRTIVYINISHNPKVNKEIAEDIITLIESKIEDGLEL